MTPFLYTAPYVEGVIFVITDDIGSKQTREAIGKARTRGYRHILLAPSTATWQDCRRHALAHLAEQGEAAACA